MEQFVMTPNVVDIGIGLFVLVGLLVGYRRGLSGELAGFISIVVAFFLGLHYSRPVGRWVEENTRLSGSGAHAMAFAVIIIGSAVCMLMLRMILRRVIRVAVAEEADRAGGMVAGAIRASLVALAVVILINLCPHEYLNRVFGEESVVGRTVLYFMGGREHGREMVLDLSAGTEDEEEDFRGED